MHEVLVGVVRLLLAMGSYALTYAGLRHGWDANQAFAAGASATFAVVLWVRTD